jgi:hypothetical protein
MMGRVPISTDRRQAPVRVNKGLLGWGVFFIVAGVVPLAVRNGAIDAAWLEGAFGLWPLILVGIGLGLLLADTKAAVLGGLLVALTLGIMAGALLAGATTVGSGALSMVGPCGLGGSQGGGMVFEPRQGTFTGPAQVELRMRCGSLDGTTAAGSGWTLTGSAGAGLAPEVDQDSTRLSVLAPSRGGLMLGADPAHWKLALPDAVPLDVALQVDAGSADVGLDRATVTGLGVEVNAGDARVGLREDPALRALDASVNAGSLVLDLPAASFRGEVDVNAGSAEVCIPAGTAVLVHADDVSLGSTNLGSRGLVQQGSTWSTPGFADAVARVELDVSVNLGSFTLDPEHGCG